MSSIIVSLKDFGKKFGDKTVIKKINLDVYEGEFLTLLGSSGCGKTTILRSISGLDIPTSGTIYIDGVDVTNLPPQKRQVNTIFQNYALFPLMTIKENVSFGLKMKNVPQEEINKRVSKMLKLVHLEGYENRKPCELSGGEQQRVSIIRGLINNPRVLLLDEPLSALDLKLRKKMHIELKQLQKKLGITFIYVTHDQDEALSMSDRIVVLKNGNIEQIGTPKEVYENPKSLFVAEFLGEANIFKGEIRDKKLVVNSNMLLNLPKNLTQDNISVVIRPENIKLTKSFKDDNSYPGVIQEKIYDGSFTKYIVNIYDKLLKVIVFGNDKEYEINDNVYVSWNIDNLIIIGSEKNEK